MFIKWEKIILGIFLFLLLFGFLLIGAKYNKPIHHLYTQIRLGTDEPFVEQNIPKPLATNFHNANFKVINLEDNLKKFYNDPEYILNTQFVSEQVIDDKIFLVGSNSLLFQIDLKGELHKVTDIEFLLPNFVRIGKGITGAFWETSTDVFIYHLSHLEGSFAMLLTWINTSNDQPVLVDSYILGEIEEHEIAALGGAMQPYKGSTYLLMGAAVIHDAPEGIKAQEEDTRFGKVLKIDVDGIIENRKMKDSHFEVIAKGLRNPQGMVVFNNKLLFVDHGPQGGDIISEITPGSNYGWNSYSYGRHYGSGFPTYNNKPLDFTEPIFYFSPVIAPSDISTCPFNNSEPSYGSCVLVSTLYDESFYIVKFHKPISQENLFVQSTERIHVGERIRKISTINGKVYLFTDLLNIYIIDYVQDYS